MDDELDKNLLNLQADSLLNWIIQNSMKSEKGVPIEFNTHRFLIDIYNDTSDDISIAKSAQVGGTIWATAASAHEVGLEGRDAIYVFPTKGSIINDFVIPKVNPLIDKNPFIKRLINLDNQKLKRLRENFLYYRGAFAESDAISISADTIWSDEYDRSNINVVRTYRSRTENSKHPRYRTFSNPSAKGYGIDLLFNQSDQMHWFVRCPHCRHYYYFDWDPANAGGIDPRAHTIDVLRKIFMCGKCGKEIPDFARQNGTWIAKYKSRERRGYWINQMMRSDRSAARLIQQWDDNKYLPGYFYNFILGKAYTPADALIDRSLFQGVWTGMQVPLNEVYIGVDVGIVKHVVVMTPEGVVDLGTYEEWDSIEALFNTLNARCMVIDALPDITVPRKLAKKYPGRVFLAEFDYNSSRQKIADFNPAKRKGFVKVQRTDIMDLLVNEMRGKTLLMHIPAEKLERLIEHSIVMVRIQEKDEEGKGKLKIFWVTQGEAPDHFWFALIYARVAMMRGMVSSGAVAAEPTKKTASGVYYNETTRKYEGVVPDYKKKLLKMKRKELRP